MNKPFQNRGRPLKGQALRERVSFTLSPEVHRQLKIEAKKQDLSKSELVEQQLSSASHLNQKVMLFEFTKLKKKIDEIARRNEIKSLSLFGSVLTENFTSQSDIDLLIEFQEGKVPGFFQFSQIEIELSEAFEGTRVDLHTYQDLSKYFREQVKMEAVSIYEN
jgi:uncharacterized protein